MIYGWVFWWRHQQQVYDQPEVTVEKQPLDRENPKHVPTEETFDKASDGLLHVTHATTPQFPRMRSSRKASSSVLAPHVSPVHHCAQMRVWMILTGRFILLIGS